MRAARDSYIKLFRKTIGHPIVWDYPFNKFQAWSWLNMMANYEDDGFLKRGEIIIGRRYLANKWGWSEARVVRFLQLLVNSNMISTRVSNDTNLFRKYRFNYDFFDTNQRTDLIPRITILTITNYNDYQGYCVEPPTRTRQTHETDFETDPETDPETVLKNKKRTINKKKSTVDQSSTATVTPRKIADTAYARVIDYHHNLFLKLSNGQTKYRFQGKKDGNAVNKLIKDCTEEQIINALDAYFADMDPFTRKQGYTWTYFESKINSYLIDPTASNDNKIGYDPEYDF